MARRKMSRSVVIEGTVTSSTREDDWESGIIIVTPESEEYQEYFVVPDETGRELAKHLFEFVRVYGFLRPDEMIRVETFDVLRFSTDGDMAWFDENGDREDPWEDERGVRTLVKAS